MEPNRISICETCSAQGKGRTLWSAEARIHQDNFPNHRLVNLDQLSEEKEVKLEMYEGRSL